MCSFINSVLVMIFLRVHRLPHQTITVTLPDCIFKPKQRKKIKNKNIWGFDGIVFKRPIHHQIAWFVKIPSQSMYPLCCVNPPEKIVFKFLFSDARKSAYSHWHCLRGKSCRGPQTFGTCIFFFVCFRLFVCFSRPFMHHLLHFSICSKSCLPCALMIK